MDNKALYNSNKKIIEFGINIFNFYYYLKLLKYCKEEYEEYPIIIFFIFSIVIIIAIIDFLIRLFFFILFICLYLYLFATCMIYGGNLCIKILISLLNIMI